MSKIESFEIDIPQLKRSRTVWVYLPDGYEQTGKPHPVIYMHDGQNLFYDKLSSYGKSWHVDVAMDEIYRNIGHGAIVVGVESNPKHRLSEYSPWKMNPFYLKKEIEKNNRGGEGAMYAEFFAKTLKHAIDSKYNTDKERSATAVIGSSMGGVISCYLGLTYQRIYETMGLFSTWTLFNQGAFDRFIRKTPQSLPQYALIYCGGKEGDDGSVKGSKQVVNCSLKLYNKLQQRNIKCELLFNSDFVHDETAWEVYFKKFATDFLARYYSAK